ncbi:hypothetical protein IAT38_003738 [Cryptococcus sp. DSM 104549]
MASTGSPPGPRDTLSSDIPSGQVDGSATTLPTVQCSACPSEKASHISAEGEKKQQIEEEEGMHVEVGQKKKWGLLFVFSLALFIDQWGFAAFFILTTPVANDLNVPFSQQTWVINSYAVTFAASLLFWGRLADLYSAKQIFSLGFISLGVLCTIISFLPEKYSFFILRALSGFMGGSTVPSAFRLIVGIFEPHELKKAFTLYGVAGATAATTGNIVAGVLELITAGGQMAGWRWLFRLMAVIILPVAVGTVFWIPKVRGAQAGVKDKWKRLDLVGSFTMLAAIICLILSLTLGATSGWKTAGFIAPFIISFILFPLFFIHEARLPTEYALLPPSTWRYPNFTTWIVFALLIQGWVAVEFLTFVELFIDVHGESSIMAAVRTLPMPVMGVVATVFAAHYPWVTAKPRVTVTVCLSLGIGAYVLFIKSGEQVGMDYWKYLFAPYMWSGVIVLVLYNMNNVGVMTSVPPEMAGVAGAVLQISVQLGNSLALAIQAGLLTVYPNGIHDFRNVQASWYLEMGWTAVWLVGFLVFYRDPKKEAGDEEVGREGGEVEGVAVH